MLKFVFQKMLANRWMTACLIIGNIFLCSIAAAIPIYTDATMNRVLQKQLQALESAQARDPGAVEITVNVRKVEIFEALGEMRLALDQLGEDMDVDVLSMVDSKTSEAYLITNLDDRETTAAKRRLSLTSYSDVEDHIQLAAGRMYQGIDDTGAIEAVVNERTMIQQDIILGDLVELSGITDQNDVPLRVRVVGVFRGVADGRYWLTNPDTLEECALVDPGVMETVFVEQQSIRKLYVQTWAMFLDYTQLDAKRAGEYESALDDFESIHRFSKSMIAQAAFGETVREQTAVKHKLVVTLLILLVPILVLLAFFIFMVSKQTLEQEKSTISVLDSRGADRSQIISIFTLQSAIIALLCGVLGVPLGIGICRIFGSANGYMELVQRTALQVRLYPDTLIYVGAAVAVSMLTMVVPAILYANVSIVENKRSAAVAGLKLRAFLPQLVLDALLFGVSLYGWYTFHNQLDALVAQGSEASVDPLIFLSSSLFIISAGLFISILIPLLIRLAYRVGRKHWSPAVYASFLRVMRASGDQRFIMVFLVLTVAIGIFNARTARTLNRNVEDNLYYENGADLVLQESWGDNARLESTSFVLYTEPDYTEWQQLDQSRDDVTVTQVMNRRTYSVGTDTGIRVMGITTTQFAKVAWMRDDLLPVHWYNYLNALASDTSALLLSSNWHEEKGYELGDVIRVKNENDVIFNGVIYGFFDYWPSYLSTVDRVDSTGNIVAKDEYLIVGNLISFQSAWGVSPYELWIRAEDPGVIYDFVEERGLQLTKLADAAQDVRQEMSDPVLQGVNGFLTVGFIVVLLVCITGYMIFWILSIRGRVLQIGTFRAMGMNLRELTGMLLSEQVLISLTSAAAGFAVGWGASELFAQLIQISFSSAFNALPLNVARAAGDNITLLVAVGGMFAVCMVLLVGFMRRIQLIGAINRGED